MANFAQSTVSPDYVPVADFFHDRCIFVTGGTGFMGKVLVEKLLRSCPGIKNIYLLIRPKKGCDINARLVELTDSPLFDKLRKERPLELNKIIPIKGDVTEPELGISPSDQQLLIRSVSIVFHSAATVKFDEALKLSVTINMLGTKRLVELCHRMLGLEALIHVSTAYCNCDRSEVNEIIYPPPYDPEKIIECMEWMDDDLIDLITPKLIGNRPNTYTFTKAMAEHMLMKESGNLPVAIVRPSIVLSSLREPVAGWVDNWNGPTGLIAAAGKGFFRTMLCEGNNVADFIPVDIVINLMIVAAWRTATSRTDEVLVYNCCTGIQKPISWNSFVNQCLFYLQKHPLTGLVWYPDGCCRSNWLLNKLSILTLHTFPAYLLDGLSRLVGKKPVLVKIQNKLDKASQCLEYFTLQQWRFIDDNVNHLNSILSPEDRETFHFDVRDINWSNYLEHYILGIRSFIFKEHPSSLPTARRKVQRNDQASELPLAVTVAAAPLQLPVYGSTRQRSTRSTSLRQQQHFLNPMLFWIHKFTQLLAVVFFGRMLFMRTSQTRRLWFFLMDLLIRMYRMLPYF